MASVAQGPESFANGSLPNPLKLKTIVFMRDRMHSMTTISVVIPLFNKARHVARALQSATAQSRSPVEIIVVDDGSTDGGLEIVRAHGGVRIFERGCQGPGGYAARNLGVREATGEWIAFLDADDEWLPDHLERLSDLAAGPTSGFVMAADGYEERHPGGRVVRDIYARHRPNALPAAFAFEDFLALWLDIGECPVWTSAILARRDAILAAGLFPEGRCRRGGDKDLWLRIAELGPVLISSRQGAIYHKDADNMVTSLAYANACHCISKSIEERLPAAASRLRRLLGRLRNHETWLYARRTARVGRLRREAWRGFDALLNPARFTMLVLFSTPLGRPTARAGAWLRSLVAAQ